MLSTLDVVDTLSELIRIYDNDTSTERELVFAAKLACIEACGWTEQAIGQILREYANASLGSTLPECINLINDMNGISYDKMRDRVIRLVGFAKSEQLEANLGRTIVLLKPLLRTLQKERNALAHSHLVVGARNYTAPSHFLSQVKELEIYLSDFENKLKAL